MANPIILGLLAAAALVGVNGEIQENDDMDVLAASIEKAEAKLENHLEVGTSYRYSNGSNRSQRSVDRMAGRFERKIARKKAKLEYKSTHKNTHFLKNNK